MKVVLTLGKEQHLNKLRSVPASTAMPTDRIWLSLQLEDLTVNGGQSCWNRKSSDGAPDLKLKVERNGRCRSFAVLSGTIDIAIISPWQLLLKAFEDKMP